MKAESYLQVGAALGEGPVRHRDGRLLWVDISRGEVNTYDHSSGRSSTYRVGEEVGAVAEMEDGSLLAACRSGLRYIDEARQVSPLVCALPRSPHVLRMNDGKADAAGRFVGGTMPLVGDRPHLGSLWSFVESGPVELVTGVSLSNGLGWSSDGGTMYYIDTPTGRIDAFEYDVNGGGVGERATAVVLADGAGSPDGMCVDVEGGIWVALWGAGEVHRYEGGSLTEVIQVPTPFVTCPSFAGPSDGQLVITTASEPFGKQPPSGAGDIFLASVGIRGHASNTVSCGLVHGADSCEAGFHR